MKEDGQEAVAEEVLMYQTVVILGTLDVLSQI